MNNHEANSACLGRRRRNGMRTLLAAAVFVSAAATASQAYYHDLANNRQPCSDCHTLHYSEGGTRPSDTDTGGPFEMLRLRSTTNRLCLMCHDGSDPKAPDVLGSSIVNAYSDEHSGAGFLASAGTQNSNGHDLGVNAPTVFFSSLTNVTLSCASCHDPHGTPNYRNILTSPAGGAGTGVVMATDVFRNLPPGDPPSISGTAGAYTKSNEGYKAKTSLWCTECHDGLRPHVGGSSRTQDHHLADDAINNYSPPTADSAIWTSGAGPGFGAATGDDTAGIPRLRFQVSNAVDFNSSRVAAADNQVICSTCHLAHGGKYQKGLVWPYLDALPPPNDADTGSGCAQCH